MVNLAVPSNLLSALEPANKERVQRRASQLLKRGAYRTYLFIFHLFNFFVVCFSVIYSIWPISNN